MEYAIKGQVKVGDGVTECMYSDAHAYTVVGVTASTIKVQRDKATLSPDFKPDQVIMGFCARTMNNNEQTYSYEPDPSASIETAYWSAKGGRYRLRGNTLITGRHEFYDYNF